MKIEIEGLDQVRSKKIYKRLFTKKKFKRFNQQTRSNGRVQVVELMAQLYSGPNFSKGPGLIR